MLLLAINLLSQNVEPYVIIPTSGAVTDFVIDNNHIYAATDESVIDIINATSGKVFDKISVPFSHDFMGDEIPSKIYSVDKIDDKVVFVWQGNRGFRNVSVKENNIITKIIDADINKLMIKKVRFIDENNILLGLLSNELILFNLKTKNIVYQEQISAYSFSDFCLNSSKTQVATTNESGIVHVIDVSNGQPINTFQNNNVDNVYQVDYKNNVIITAGQDRRVGIYNTIINNSYYLQENFLVYSVGLSNDGLIGAFCASEDNEISIFDINSKTILHNLVGHNSTITKIIFTDNNTVVTSAEEPIMIIWKIQ